MGVFVNLAAAEVLQIAELCGLDLIQLHGGETGDYCSRFPRERLIKALSFRSEKEFVAMADYPVRAFLVDAHDPVRFGGTGKTCDWNLARKAAARHPLILAGGLGTENILAALETVRPLAVDISSGVEVQPGRKDHEKIRSVVAAVRCHAASGPTVGKESIFKNPPVIPLYERGIKIFAPFDRGCIPPGGTTMYGSFLAGMPREAEGGFKKGAGGEFI